MHHQITADIIAFTNHNQKLHIYLFLYRTVSVPVSRTDTKKEIIKNIIQRLRIVHENRRRRVAGT